MTQSDDATFIAQLRGNPGGEMREPAFQAGGATIYQGDVLAVLRELPADHYHCIVTSPPYWGLRSYLKPGDPLKQYELGSEPTPAAFIENMVAVFRECRRVLHPTGQLWVNIGDTYNAYNGNRGRSTSFQAATEDAMPDLPSGNGLTDIESLAGEPVGIPDMLKNALRADGWRHRDTVIWSKPAPMPASLAGWRWVKCRVKVKGKWTGDNIHPSKLIADGQGHCGDNQISAPHLPGATWADCPGCPRCSSNGGYVLRKGQWRTTTAHEYLFMFVKSDRYFADAAAVKEPATGATISRNQYSRVIDDPDEQYAVKHDHEFQGATRNPRSVQTWGPEPCKFAHYAAFVSALPRFAIRCSTSAKGCCATCGTPWSPIVESPTMIPVEASDQDRFGTGEAGIHRKVGQAYQDWRDENPDKVQGYRPSCSCPPAPAVPCRVLDPFAGTGTSLVAALELGCEGTGIELNPQYIGYAIERLSAYLVPKGQAPTLTPAAAGPLFKETP